MNSTYFIEQVMRDGNMQYGVYSLKDKAFPILRKTGNTPAIMLTSTQSVI